MLCQKHHSCRLQTKHGQGGTANRGGARNFYGGGGGGIISTFSWSAFFSAEQIWNWFKNKKSSKGVREHVPPDIFWKFTCCNGYFSAFWIIFRQIWYKFFECFAKYDAFCSHIIDYAKDVRLVAINEFRNYGKIVNVKNIFENGWWEDAYSSSYPLAISYTNHQKNLAYFSHLAPLVLFLFTKRRSQKGGMEQWPRP